MTVAGLKCFYHSKRIYNHLERNYSSGKKIDISRSADSSESEPCIRFSGISDPKSPLIVPASASAGSVAPINCLFFELLVIADEDDSETIKFFGNLKHVSDWSYIESLIERLDFDSTRKTKDLSKGNKQKLGLILALMNKPKLLVLDEPTSGLDPLMQQTSIDLLKEIQQNGTTIFLSSHIFSEIDKVAETVGFIKEGELIVEDELDTLKANAVKSLSIEFKHPIPEDLFKDSTNIQIVESKDTSVTINVTGPVDDVIKKISQFEVVDLLSEEASLEDVFMNYYGSN